MPAELSLEAFNGKTIARQSKTQNSVLLGTEHAISLEQRARMNVA
jgi:hypothetical protein